MKDIQRFLKDNCDKMADVYPGLAVAIVDGDKQYLHFAGVENDVTGQAIDEDTPFEIGSVTKLFTGILLAKLANDGLVELDQTCQFALPNSVQLPEVGRHQLTFRRLSNHTSGLPRLPDNLDLSDANAEDPYANYSVQDLYEYLSTTVKISSKTSRPDYSNLGVGLLGHLLGRIDESDFVTALQRHVLEPLQLNSTAVDLPPHLNRRLAQPHIGDLKTSTWSFQDSTVAAGGLKSTLGDMIKFVRANLEPSSAQIGAAISLAQTPAPQAHRKIHSLQTKILGGTMLVLLSMAAMFGFDIRPGNFTFLATLFAGTVTAALLWGRWVSYAVLFSTIALVAWKFGDGFDWPTVAVIGFILASIVSRFKRSPTKAKGRLGWQESSTPFFDDEILWHNGMVGGSSSYLAIIPAQNRGVVVLTNTSIQADALGYTLALALVTDPPAD